MMNNFDRHIQGLLNSYAEQPSADCWNKISSQLDALQMPDANTGSSASTGGNTSSFSQFVGSVSGKIVSVVVAAATVGGIIALVMVNSPENDAKTEENTMVVADETQNELVILNETDAQNATNVVVLSEENRNTDVENIVHFPDENKDTSFADNQTVSAPNPIQNSVATSVVQSETDNTAKTEAVLKTENNTQKTSKEPKKKFFADNDKSVPVEEATPNDTPDKIEPPKFIIPNIITPNGDNVNDYFVIENIEQFYETHLYISDRYGKVVYEKSNYQNNWGAENLPNEVYFYIFKYVYKGTQFMRNGSVTVRR